VRMRQSRRLRYAAFAAIAAVLATAGAANAASIDNGSFTNGLTGWTSVSHGSGSWQQVQFVGPSGHLQNGFTVPTDSGQPYAAGTTQTGPGDHTLYQDVALETGQSHLLSLDWYYNNYNGTFSTPTSLSYLTYPNQQARIDVVDPSAPLGTLSPSNILATIMATPAGSPAVSGWHHDTVDLSAFAGRTVRLRFAMVDNQYYFALAVTNVHITSTVLNHAPTATVAGVTDGAKYEYGTVPAATCQVSDIEDGSKTLPATLSAITGPLASAGLGSQTASCSYADAGGLTASASATYTIVDTAPPAITVPADVTATATSAAGAPVQFTAATAVDLVDGTVAVTCDHASGDMFALGATTVTCTSTDASGNTSTKSFTVTVTYSWSGVLAPVTSGGSYHQGRTLPVQFTLTVASTPVTNAVVKLYLAKRSGGTVGAEFAATSTSGAVGDNSFRFDGTGYIFNLATKGLSAGTYQLRIDLGDGVNHTTDIKLS
jgi:hypothetical protein